MRLGLTGLGFIAALSLLPSMARAQVDGEVRNHAASLTVKSGETAHNVGDEIAKLDGMRAKITAAINAKIDAKDFNIGDELKTLARLDRYSAKLADLVAIQNPNATDVTGWLQANAAVAGTWLEAYTGTGRFTDNTRLAELKAIKTRLGHSFSGAMDAEIKSLLATEASATGSAALEELGRRVRLASGLIDPRPGLINLGLRVQPAAVTAGDKVTTVVALALGGGGGAGPPGFAETERITYDFGVTGPQSFSLGTLKKMYAPGASLASTSYFTIDTKGLPNGIYTASLSATDTHGHSLSAKDTFEVRIKPPPPDGSGPHGISPAMTAAYAELVKSQHFESVSIFGAHNTDCTWHANSDVEVGNLTIDDYERWKKTWENQQTNHLNQKFTINGRPALLQKFASASGNPTVDIYWLNSDRWCAVSVRRSTGPKGAELEKELGDCEKRAKELAGLLDDTINKVDAAHP